MKLHFFHIKTKILKIILFELFSALNPLPRRIFAISDKFVNSQFSCPDGNGKLFERFFTATNWKQRLEEARLQLSFGVEKNEENLQ